MSHTSEVPHNRVRALNDAPVRASGDYVVYWMTANRRTEWNFALQHAVARARELDRPLVILEALRADYRWAADRFHRFILDGMADNYRRLETTAALYYPFVEADAGAGKGLLEALASRASVVVTDDTPSFFYPAMLAAAAARLAVSLEAVDACGLLPLRCTDQAFKTAYSFRRFLQKNLPSHLDRTPRRDPLADATLGRLDARPEQLAPGFEPTPLEVIEDPATLARLPIDHAVGAVAPAGGASAARARLHRFVADLLPRYGEERNHPSSEHNSRLSAYLHFGHISPHEVFATVAAEEMWTQTNLAEVANGARQGWWGMSAASETFLDQLVTWRELGFNMCHHRDDYDHYSSLPDWAAETLDAHRNDERPHLYAFEEFDAAATHDEIWNAAQTQLATEGRIHNYLRMLWGKKILEWSATPEEALAIMIDLNNRYALDGRDPNSYSGIFWVLGRYDRPWGPERPVFGKVRYMSSANTARKLRLGDYLSRFTPTARPASETSP